MLPCWWVGKTRRKGLKMNVLVACEESQVVCSEFRKLGHNAFSCDLKETSGKHNEWHIRGDVTSLLNGACSFKTEDGIIHTIDREWDLVIAHPPCTHLATSGARHFAKKRLDGRQKEAIEFFYKFVNCNAKLLAIENPVGIISGNYIKEYFDIEPLKPTQIIQPYEYGNPARKKTCLWLRGLNKLQPTNIVEPKLVSYICKDGKKVTFSEDYCKGGGDNSTRRSKTYSGVAEAMANQWGKEL